MRLHGRTLRCAGLLWLLCACDSRLWNLVSDEAVEAGVPAAAAKDAAAKDAAAKDAAPPVSDAAQPDAAAVDGGTQAPAARCGKAACACDDRLDNDGDGLVDGLDPECTGALDEDEASFATGNPSKAKACRDCFWDDNAGSGNDSCRYPEACLRGVDPTGNGNCSRCDVSAGCVTSCASRTPNGCDCFGCCEVSQGDGVILTIELSERCSLDKLNDHEACPRCVQNTGCRNPCGRCELCPGRRPADLPADCGSTSSLGEPTYACDEGQVVCTTSGNCPSDTYCQLGCCLPALL